MVRLLQIGNLASDHFYLLEVTIDWKEFSRLALVIEQEKHV